jgi:hypothetical protein
MTTHNQYREIETDATLQHGAAKKSASSNLLLFLIALGWQGPLAMLFGLNYDNTGVTVFGGFITAYFWGCFGLKYLLLYLDEVVRR